MIFRIASCRPCTFRLKAVRTSGGSVFSSAIKHPNPCISPPDVMLVVEGQPRSQLLRSCSGKDQTARDAGRFRRFRASCVGFVPEDPKVQKQRNFSLTRRADSHAMGHLRLHCSP